MNSILEFYSSSIGKKVFMSLTGVFLITFLIEHLIGNLLLFANDHGAKYEAYGNFLVSNPLIRFIEIFLFLFLFIHAFLGIYLWLVNRYKQDVQYKSYRLRDNVPLASRTWMIALTGCTIAIFLYLHLRSFFWPIRITGEYISEYELVVRAFANLWYDVFYVVAMVLLGYHLRHGFQSVFQTLGLRNKKFTSTIDLCAFVFWFLIPAGYASIPIYFYCIQLGGH